MVDRNPSAEGALVAVCAYFVMSSLSDKDLDLWVSHLRGVLDECDGCVEALVPMRSAADRLCGAAINERRGPLARLRVIVRDYYGLQAGARLEAMRRTARSAA